MKTFVAILIGIFFIIVVIKYYIRAKLYYDMKIEKTVKNMGYKNYRQYKRIEGKAEKRRILRYIYEKE